MQSWRLGQTCVILSNMDSLQDTRAKIMTTWCKHDFRSLESQQNSWKDFWKRSLVPQDINLKLLLTIHLSYNWNWDILDKCHNFCTSVEHFFMIFFSCCRCLICKTKVFKKENTETKWLSISLWFQNVTNKVTLSSANKLFSLCGIY